MNYYVSVGGNKNGPYTRKQLTSMWNSGAITADALYYTEGMVEWQRVSELMGSETGDAPGASDKGKPPLGILIGRAVGRGWRKLMQRAGSGRGGEKAPRDPDTRRGQASPRFDQRSSGDPGLPLSKRLLVIGIVAIVIIGVVSLSSGPHRSRSRSDSSSEGAATVVSGGAERAEQPYVPPPPPRNTYPAEIQQWLTEAYHEDMNREKQSLFNALHPIGTAKSVKVTDATIRWKNGTERRRWEDIAAYTLQFVLYWEGPIISDGYTQVDWTFDTVLERFTSYRIVQSNGITKDDLAETLGTLAESAFKELVAKSR